MHNLKHHLNNTKIIMMCTLIGLYCGIAQTQVSASEATYEIGTGNTSYQYNDLKNRYQWYSSTYMQKMLGYQIEALNYSLTSESSASISSQFATAVDKCSRLKQLKQEYMEYRSTVSDAAILAELDAQIQTISDQIEQYNSTINSYQSSLAESNLKAEIEQFYVNYQSLINQEAQNKLLNDFMKKCYGLILLQEQEDYYVSNNDYLSTIQRIEKIKTSHGVSTQISSDIATANLLKNKLALQENVQSLYTAYTEIKTETNVAEGTRILLPIAVSPKQYGLEETILQYEYRNMALAQYSHLKQCYQRYLSSNNKTNTQYHQIELKIQDYQLQHNVLKNNIRKYVTEAIYAYDNEFRNLELADKEFQIAQKNYNIMVTKKKYKKSTELDVTKAKSEMESAEVAYYQCIYKIIIWRDILDNGIYGVTP